MLQYSLQFCLVWNQEVQQAARQEQIIAEGCKRLIQNAIICWNYLYLSQLILDTEEASAREAIVETVRNGSVVVWQHVNFQGEYNFSDEALKHRFEFDLPKLLQLEIPV